MWLSPFRHVYFAPCLSDAAAWRQGSGSTSSQQTQPPETFSPGTAVGSGPSVVSQGDRSIQV